MEQGQTLDLNDLVLFARLAHSGGITAAAESMNRPKSSISRRLERLEAVLGARFA